MQSLLQQRINRLDRMRAWLFLAITVYWVGQVAYFPLAPGETVTTATWKCVFVVALVLPLFITGLRPWIVSLCFYAGFAFQVFASPLNWEAADVLRNWNSLPLGIFFVLALCIDGRRLQLTSHSNPRWN